MHPEHMDNHIRRISGMVIALVASAILVACTGGNPLSLPGSPSSLYVPDLLDRPQEFNGKDITVSGAYLNRYGREVLALGVSTLDNGLDAQPLGEPIWLEGFPQEATAELHRPGDAVYGFVRVKGRCETGGPFGAETAYRHRILGASAEPIERIRRPA